MAVDHVIPFFSFLAMLAVLLPAGPHIRARNSGTLLVRRKRHIVRSDAEAADKLSLALTADRMDLHQQPHHLRECASMVEQY